MIDFEILDELLDDYFEDHITITQTALNEIIGKAEELTKLIHLDDGK